MKFLHKWFFSIASTLVFLLCFTSGRYLYASQKSEVNELNSLQQNSQENTTTADLGVLSSTMAGDTLKEETDSTIGRSLISQKFAIQDAKELLIELQGENTGLKKKLGELELQYENVSAKVTLFKLENDELKSAAKNWQSQYNDKLEELRNNKNLIYEQRQELIQLKNIDNMHKNKNAKEENEEIKRLKNEIKRLKNEITEYKKDVTALNATNKQLNSEIEEYQQIIKGKQKKEVSYKKKVSELTIQIDELLIENDALNAELSKLESMLDDKSNDKEDNDDGNSIPIILKPLLRQRTRESLENYTNTKISEELNTYFIPQSRISNESNNFTTNTEISAQYHDKETIIIDNSKQEEDYNSSQSDHVDFLENDELKQKNIALTEEINTWKNSLIAVICTGIVIVIVISIIAYLYGKSQAKTIVVDSSKEKKPFSKPDMLISQGNTKDDDNTVMPPPSTEGSSNFDPAFSSAEQNITAGKLAQKIVPVSTVQKNGNSHMPKVLGFLFCIIVLLLGLFGYIRHKRGKSSTT